MANHIGIETFKNNMRNSEQVDQGESVQMDHQDLLVSGNTVQKGGMDLNNLKFEIKSTDMSENMITYVVEKTILAFESTQDLVFKKDMKKNEREILICKRIKIGLESIYHKHWQVICGDNYGSFFTHYKGSFIVFCFEGKWITIFRSA